jgi:hypothetical protein
LTTLSNVVVLKTTPLEHTGMISSTSRGDRAPQPFEH